MAEERRIHRSGHCLRIDPEGVEALTKDKSIEEAIKKHNEIDKDLLKIAEILAM